MDWLESDRGSKSRPLPWQSIEEDKTLELSQISCFVNNMGTWCLLRIINTKDSFRYLACVIPNGQDLEIFVPVERTERASGEILVADKWDMSFDYALKVSKMPALLGVIKLARNWSHFNGFKHAPPYVFRILLTIAQAKESESNTDSESEASFNDFSDKEKNQISQNLSSRKAKKSNKKSDEYDGEYKDGKYHGEGRLSYSNGDEYSGGWKDGKYDGEGELSYSNGDVYFGGWKDGKYHGEGRLEYSNEDVYLGEWKAGKKHGYIKMYLNNGEEFVGTFKQDKKHGRSYSTKNLDLFEGDWKDGKALDFKKIKSNYYCKIYYDKTGIHYKKKFHSGVIVSIILGCFFLLILCIDYVSVQINGEWYWR